MIYVRIELWPLGNRERARLLQEVHIANDGTGDRDRGNYRAMVSHSTTFRGSGFADPQYPADSEVWKRGQVKNHDRKQAPAALVWRALGACLGRGR